MTSERELLFFLPSHPPFLLLLPPPLPPSSTLPLRQPERLLSPTPTPPEVSFEVDIGVEIMEDDGKGEMLGSLSTPAFRVSCSKCHMLNLILCED